MDTATFVAIAGLLTVLGGLSGLALGRYAWPAIRSDQAAALTSAQIEAARLSERTAGLERQIDEQAGLARSLEAQRVAAEAEAKAAGAEVARLSQRESDLSAKIADQATQLAEMQKQLTSEFENIANRILRAKAVELSEGSQKELGAILDPLRERIQDLQKKVETTYDAEIREVLSLKEQIKIVLDTSNAVGSQADGLAKALRGDSQVLGRWGEITLERILEAAGLSQGRDYISQGRGMGLRDASGGLQKPDIVIKLPEDRSMIIDAKVSLAGYERLAALGDEKERAGLRGQFVRDVKAHIDGLAGKRYQENEKLLAHDYVLMFVPIESALSEALKSDPGLVFYGWDRRVVLVGPSNLLMTMQTVASIWGYQRQRENAQEIARLAGELCDKVRLSLIDLNVVAEKMADANAAHSDAVKRLSTGRGNLLSVGERIRILGVKSKPMPSMLVDGATIAAPEPFTDDEIPVLAPSLGTVIDGEESRDAAE
ncbi:MAG TPA: DNA recombination protein RmuC [Stellaceae bacterium]|nr:DNA recombination protein RmuC [Stellaceae bacterium]